MQDASEIIQRFSRQTGIVDKDVNLLIDGLENCPSKQFLFTPGGSDPVYYAIDYATHIKEERRKGLDEMFKERYYGTWGMSQEKEEYYVELGRGIAVNNNPRKCAVMRGIKPL